ncbi:helix-turn-helix transcriptional regulator [Thermosediminibacter oceani]|uniref:CBS domain containing protein n=1 Tax=Thermosediminibacter oceani (strain ATCC BAA-1034 / DSM 16646 / JW/IW-1228P) TaxID=555079 RepID=D9S2R1_THEOJ|nr:helix-turn-helix transcriptional regulator [Thermosediminibacter oceani]ADL07688.1 CBS domain containing protein [Thermosediminibacter oceani DSM 16646]
MMIVDIVKKHEPITSEEIAAKLNITRAALRPDLSILTMAGILEARPRVGYFYAGKNTKSLLAEKIRSIKVSDIKAVPVVIKEETSVYDAIVTLFLEDVGTLFVVQEDGSLCGVVSRKDLLKIAMGNADIRQIPVSVIMTRMPNLVTVTMEESAFDAARKIVEHQVDALPVVKPEEFEGKVKYKVVGKVTKTTITRLFVELGRG